MTRFIVDVREDVEQSAWRLHAPEVSGVTWVFDKADIPDAARQLIDRCGGTPKDFEVDVVFGAPFPVYRL